MKGLIKVSKSFRRFFPLSANQATKLNQSLIRKIEAIDVKIENKLETLSTNNVKNAVNIKLCPVCMTSVKAFNLYGIPPSHKKCPTCKSISRHRFLYLYLYKNKVFSKTTQIKILHFSPEKAFYDIFINHPCIDYYPVEFNPEFGSHRNIKLRDVVDITNIQYSDDTFDIIICNHVLEHVNDFVAMNELLRVLKKDGGQAFIMVPTFENLERTLENPEYNTPELRAEFYGQHDHVRKYGRDFSERLLEVGFAVKEIRADKYLSKEERTLYHINKQSIYIATA